MIVAAAVQGTLSQTRSTALHNISSSLRMCSASGTADVQRRAPGLRKRVCCTAATIIRSLPTRHPSMRQNQAIRVVRNYSRQKKSARFSKHRDWADFLSYSVGTLASYHYKSHDHEWSSDTCRKS